MAHKFLGNTKSKNMNHAGQSTVGKARTSDHDDSETLGTQAHEDKYGKKDAEKGMRREADNKRDDDRYEEEQKARADKNDKYEGRHHTK